MNKGVKLIRITTVPISLKLLLTDQMRFMKENGFEVIMISSEGKEIREIIENEKSSHIAVNMTRKISPLRDLISLAQLIILFLRLKPDIVHSHTPKAGLLSMLAAKICLVKCRIHTVAGLPVMTASGFRKKILIFTEKLTYWASNYVLPNSNSLKKYIIDEKLCKESKVKIIGYGSSNGIDLNRYSKANLDIKKLENIKATIKFDQNYDYLLFVGRLVYDKGIIELIKAFDNLRLNNKNIKLILIGPFENERNEETLPIEIILKIQNDDSIIYIPWTDDVEYYMAFSKLLIHPSHREGFPNVILQAGAMECPVICSAIPGNIDIIDNTITGTLFSKGSADELLLKLCLILSDYYNAKELAFNLRERIEVNFDRKFIHKELLDFYKKNCLKHTNSLNAWA